MATEGTTYLKEGCPYCLKVLIARMELKLEAQFPIVSSPANDCDKDWSMIARYVGEDDASFPALFKDGKMICSR